MLHLLGGVEGPAQIGSLRLFVKSAPAQAGVQTEPGEFRSASRV